MKTQVILHSSLVKVDFVYRTYQSMLPQLFVLPQVPMSGTRHSDMDMGTLTLILGQKHVKFSNIPETDTWTHIHAGHF